MVEVPDELLLTQTQARVLGALVEKAATTPDAYPMTLKALTTACNQSSNRDPVVSYEAQLVETTLMALKGKGLVRMLYPGSGERSTKFRHVLDEALHLDSDDLALVCVLLLRGAQTAAELKTRTERLHPFGSVADVEATLERLAARDRPLVVQLERQPGQKERRWMQLLEAGATERAEAAAHSAAAPAAGRRSTRIDELNARVEALEAQVASLLSDLGT